MGIKDRSHIEPTLFIGLGGAGGRVLGRLRRLFRTQYQADGSKNSPVQFLLIDTDDFRKLDPTVRGELNEQEEFVSISHFNPRQYIDAHKNDHRSDLHRWFDWETRPLLEDAFVRDGASRLRTLGRLCLHRRYHDVEKLIAAKIARAKSASAHLESGGEIRKTERPFRVVLLGSTLGGTGSGIFLDVVYMVNRLIRNSGATPDVLGFLFLPFWFIEQNRQIDTDLVPYYQANAWAFFEELNHVLLRPSRLAEIALDPSRPHGVEPDPQRADYEPLKTVFLIDSEIPNVGSFDGDQLWYQYVAQGIFQVFLAPEEGNLESVFSNIKTKLAETDHRFGLKKRFAAFGYADVRHPGRELREYYAQRAAKEYVQSQLLGAPAADAELAAADDLFQHLQRLTDTQVAAIAAVPHEQLQLSHFSTQQGQRSVANLGALRSVGNRVDTAIHQFNARFPSTVDLDEVVRTAEAQVASRLAALELGLVGEHRVIEQVRRRLTSRAPQGTSSVAPGASFTAGNLDGFREISDEVNRRGPVPGVGIGGASTDAASYVPLINRMNRDLQEKMEVFKAGAADGASAYLIERIAGVGADWQDPHAAREPGGPIRLSSLGTARALLDRAIAALSTAAATINHEAALRQAGAQGSLTSRFYPTIGEAEQAWAACRHEYHRILDERRRDLSGLMQRLRPLLFPASDHFELEVQEIEAVVEAITAFFLQNAPADYDVVLAIETDQRSLQERAARGDEEAGKESERLRNFCHNLFALSVPCCRVDQSKIARGDTTPTVVVAASSRDDSKVQHLLQLPSQVGVIDNDGSQLALLQATYAFSSHAVAGMDTLREAYHVRDKERSFPHIQREWNRKGLVVSRRGGLADPELLQFARVRALSDMFANWTSTHELLPVTGINIVTGGYEERTQQAWLARYEKDMRTGQQHLRVRAIQPMPDRARWWQLSDEVVDLHPIDLDQNIRHYLAHPIREGHSRFLEAEIHELERGSQRAVFEDSYRKYAGHLDRNADVCGQQGRQVESEMYARMSRLLRDYVGSLAAADVPVA